ncbi:hypothetical protein CALCODRAFT_504885, partial [Calocera cornea HHB12733]
MGLENILLEAGKRSPSLICVDDWVRSADASWTVDKCMAPKWRWRLIGASMFNDYDRIDPTSFCHYDTMMEWDWEDGDPEDWSLDVWFGDDWTSEQETGAE